jgi:hypothetical protein
MSPADRAKSLHALSEAAREEGDLKTADALKAAAGAWERIAGPGVAWSHKQLQGDLLRLRLDVVAYRGPFQPPQPPKAPSPSQEPLSPTARAAARVQLPEGATIEF